MTSDEVLVVRIPAGDGARATDPRAMRTRAAVVEAATVLFLQRGYLGTSVEDIAGAAGVSKRTIYNNFGDKERLFVDIVLGVTATADRFADELVGDLSETSDVDADLRRLARRHLAAVARPQVLRLRRLIVSEAERFPDLARDYHRRAPGRVLDALAGAFGSLGERGLLRVPDPARAAEHFSFLVLGAVLDRAMFTPAAPPLSAEELDDIADDAARAFLAAYRTG